MIMNLRSILVIIFVLGICCSVAAESLTDSVRVHFRVRQTDIDTQLMDNDASLQRFARRMQALSSNDSVSVTVNTITITGAASPESTVAVNEFLSRKRAAAITRWLQSYFQFPDTLPQFVFKGRDWQGLLALVKVDPDVPYKKEVEDLLEKIVIPPPYRQLRF